LCLTPFLFNLQRPNLPNL